MSLKDGNFYTGITSNLRNRFSEHAEGKVYSTKHRRPLKLIYFKGCLTRSDATRRGQC